MTMRKVRESLGVSREQLASDVGCSYITIASLETSKRSPSVGLAMRIANRLGTTVDALFCAQNTDKK